MLTSADFWRNQVDWPRDTPDLVFLGRAVHDVGAALFEDGWTGEEMSAEPIHFSLTADDRTVNNLIARHLPEFNRREFRFSMAPPPTSSIWEPHIEHIDIRPKFVIPSEERAAIRAFVEVHNSNVALAGERVARVHAKIAGWAADKQLATEYRHEGEFHRIPPAWWNYEKFTPRFAFCKIDPKNPFGGFGGTLWIFVSKTGLAKLLASRTEVTSASRGRIQTWLEAEFKADPARKVTKEKFAQKAAEKFKISPDANAFADAWTEAVKTDPKRSRKGRRPRAD